MSGDYSGEISQIPMAIDLDGTLICCNSFRRELRSIIKGGRVLKLLANLVATRSYTRSQIKEQVSELAEYLDYSECFAEEVLSLLEKHTASKHAVVIATGASSRSVEQIIQQLHVNVPYVASSRKINLTGKKKAAALIELFGEGGFVYIGDSKVDFHVFKAAKGATLVTHSRELIVSAKNSFQHIKVVAPSKKCTH